jgi:hypothetical protein
MEGQMARKYVAFDIETAKILPAHVQDLRAHRPLGISCAATLSSDDGSPRLWYGRTRNQKPAPRMTRNDAENLVRFLSEMTDAGFTILTWNGLGFDFEILAEESELWDECRHLARAHVDMMFHAFCELGYPLSLNSAAAGMRLQGKSATVAQHMAPQLWADGKTDAVLDYVTQDARTTLEVATTCEAQRVLRWVARSGNIRDMRLRSGWLSVHDAMRLSQPDTSWMDNPIPRTRFTGWLNQP